MRQLLVLLSFACAVSCAFARAGITGSGMVSEVSTSTTTSEACPQFAPSRRLSARRYANWAPCEPLEPPEGTRSCSFYWSTPAAPSRLEFALESGAVGLGSDPVAVLAWRTPNMTQAMAAGSDAWIFAWSSKAGRANATDARFEFPLGTVTSDQIQDLLPTACAVWGDVTDSCYTLEWERQRDTGDVADRAMVDSVLLFGLAWLAGGGSPPNHTHGTRSRNSGDTVDFAALSLVCPQPCPSSTSSSFTTSTATSSSLVSSSTSTSTSTSSSSSSSSSSSLSSVSTRSSSSLSSPACKNYLTRAGHHGSRVYANYLSCAPTLFSPTVECHLLWTVDGKAGVVEFGLETGLLRPQSPSAQVVVAWKASVPRAEAPAMADSDAWRFTFAPAGVMLVDDVHFDSPTAIASDEDQDLVPQACEGAGSVYDAYFVVEWDRRQVTAESSSSPHSGDLSLNHSVAFGLAWWSRSPSRMGWPTTRHNVTRSNRSEDVINFALRHTPCLPVACPSSSSRSGSRSSGGGNSGGSSATAAAASSSRSRSAGFGTVHASSKASATTSEVVAAVSSSARSSAGSSPLRQLLLVLVVGGLLLLALLGLLAGLVVLLVARRRKRSRERPRARPESVAPAASPTSSASSESEDVELERRGAAARGGGDDNQPKKGEEVPIYFSMSEEELAQVRALEAGGEYQNIPQVED